MNKVIVNNKRVVEEATCIKMYDQENILENNRCKEFIDNNKIYLESLNKDILNEFYLNIGIKILHICIDDNSGKYYYFSYKGYGKILDDYIFDNHITVIDNYNNIEIKNNKFICDGNELCDLNNNRIDVDLYNDNVIRNHLYLTNDINEQINIIKNEYGKEFNYNNVKQIYLSMYGELFILLNDGTLLCDDKVYATLVDTIWSLDSYTSYIIFKDNRVEYLSSRYSCPDCKQYKDIIYNDFFIGFLSDNLLELFIKLYEPDMSIYSCYGGIKMIQYDGNINGIICDNNMIIYIDCFYTEGL